MKLLKIFGIVAGLHALALLLILINPGCSSSKGSAAAQPAAPAKADASPVPEAPPPPIVAAPTETAPEAPAPSAAPIGGVFYSPTRPGTPAAAALENQPPADVTPAETYTVGRGDSLWSIAKKKHLRISALAAANHLHSGSVLHLGQKLIIPGRAAAEPPPAVAAPPASSGRPPSAASAAQGLRHTVRPGESLSSIAHHYRIRVGDLATANNISDPQKIRPGQELIIPSRGSSSRSARSQNPAPESEGGIPRIQSSSTASPPVPPASNQDLDSGLQTAPANPAPVIQITPQPAPANSASPQP